MQHDTVTEARSEFNHPKFVSQPTLQIPKQCKNDIALKEGGQGALDDN